MHAVFARRDPSERAGVGRTLVPAGRESLAVRALDAEVAPVLHAELPAVPEPFEIAFADAECMVTLGAHEGEVPVGGSVAGEAGLPKRPAKDQQDEGQEDDQAQAAVRRRGGFHEGRIAAARGLAIPPGMVHTAGRQAAGSTGMSWCGSPRCG